MLRFVIYTAILILFARALRRLWAGVMEGMGAAPGRGKPNVPLHGVQMVRDPICGTFIVPSRAVAGRGRHGEAIYFCSNKCRDQHASLAAGDRAHGRTA